MYLNRYNFPPKYIVEIYMAWIQRTVSNFLKQILLWPQDFLVTWVDLRQSQCTRMSFEDSEGLQDCMFYFVIDPYMVCKMWNRSKYRYLVVWHGSLKYETLTSVFHVLRYIDYLLDQICLRIGHGWTWLVFEDAEQAIYLLGLLSTVRYFCILLVKGAHVYNSYAIHWVPRARGNSSS